MYHSDHKGWGEKLRTIRNGGREAGRGTDQVNSREDRI